MRKTRDRKTSKKEISSDFFVGYVEDDESVEAIMKKFQELDEIKKEFLEKKSDKNVTEKNLETSTTTESEPKDLSIVKSDSSLAEQNSTPNINPDSVNQVENTEALPNDFFAEVFKRTSAFTVKGALMDEEDLEVLNDVEIWRAEMQGNSEYEDEEDDYFNVEENDFWDDEFGGSGKSKYKGSRKGYSRSGHETKKLGLREQILQRYKYMQVQIKDRNGHTFFVKRKISTVNPLLPTYVRIPPNPIPISWVKNILPISSNKETNFSINKSVASIIDMDWSEFKATHHAVYMDPPLLSTKNSFYTNKSEKRRGISLDELARVPVGKLLHPGGFLFIWIEKEFLPDIFSISELHWNLKYVENFCWIKKSTNNQISRLPSRYFSRSKLTCLIFRASGDVDMRHQRSPDSFFDFIKPNLTEDGAESKPEYIYTVIETLLPKSICSEEMPTPDRLLGLWSPKGYSRSSWSMISENQKAE
ncbi:hypothetical protein BB559_006390 [Furculomyces boomerangus]|uniref:Uncharacterized protein n=1 Tax=Furculomyces boomerangus TaxID=61424 RepID=A0A2T9Y399_9FUNG|nr:hypothetical protein BB559_007019 [Furculomyces boomerangus]PVU86822.1 hypothetical protein BB559_006390 [Furculomyces boomerangus]